MARSKRKRETDKPRLGRWWLADEGEVHARLLDVVKGIVDKDPRRPWLELMRQLYIDEPLSQTTRDETGYFRPEMRTRWPALRSACDTVVSKIGKDHARSQILTIDGDWDLSNAAENRTNWLDGEVERLDADRLMEEQCHDAVIYGSGHIHVFERHGRPAIELVYTGELFADPLEAKHRCIRSRFRIKPIDREVLAELYPEYRKQVDDADNVLEVAGLTPTGDEASDIVIVVEAWRLPSSPEAPGRHAICIDGCDLFDEPWKDETFPFSDLFWSRDPMKPWGIGLPEQLMGPQAELNEIAETTSASYHLMVPSVWVDSATEVTAEQITNEVAKVYIYKGGGGNPPQLFDGSSAAERFARREAECIARMFQLGGVSEFSATSTKPAGLNSGKAIEVFQDVETTRFASFTKNYERAHIQRDKLLLATADKIAARGGSAKLSNIAGNDGLEQIEWGDANLGDAPYVIRVFPVSSLSKQFSAKINEVEQMIGAGLITDMAEARELLDAPDLQRYNSIESAGRDWVRKHVSLALRKGTATPLNPFVPLSFFIRWGTLSLDLAEIKGCPEAHLEALRSMLGMATDMQRQIDLANQPPAPPAMPAGMPHGGGPAMPPPGGVPPPEAGPPPLALVPPGA